MLFSVRIVVHKLECIWKFPLTLIGRFSYLIVPHTTQKHKVVLLDKPETWEIEQLQ